MNGINWEAEIQKAKFWSGQKDCCRKFIDLAKQINDELVSYKSMWAAEFELRKNMNAELDATKLDVDYYRGKAMALLDESQVIHKING